MELFNVGSQCQEPECRQLDYLPIECNLCHKRFCGEHYKIISQQQPLGHKCQFSTIDIKAIVCPICERVVPVNKGEDANERVNRHIQQNCPKEDGSTTGKAFSNACSHKGCTKKELIPIVCSKCSLKFCIKHRLEPDHQCKGPSKPPASRMSASGSAALQRIRRKAECIVC